MIQTNMISFQQTHANGNNSYTANHSLKENNKYSVVRWKQHSLSKSNIIFRESPCSVLIT